ncbi:MAG: class I adenylate-forming enzyme family protein, partial [Gemmatimonadaceae bacterium]
RWQQATGVELRQGYGLTEAGPVCLFNRVDQPNRRGTLGSPLRGVEVTIQDPDSGAISADGETGEICVRGATVSAGYVGGAAAAGLARRGGWLRTGDLGVRHPDGCVSFRGVIKRMFTRDGYNIYPAELERVVRRQQGVRDVRVTGVPSAEREHDIRLEITGRTTEDAVRRWCREQLSAYKQPGEVMISQD